MIALIGSPQSRKKITAALFICALIIFIFAILPVFAKKFFRTDFLPSSEWVYSTWHYSIFVGIFCGLVFVFPLFAIQQTDNAVNVSSGDFFIIPLGALAIGWISILSVSVGLPFIFTIVFGKYGSLHYVVEKANSPAIHRCLQKIELRDLPFMFDHLCGFPEEFRNSLRPGMELEVFGRSTQLGVFASGVQAVNP